LGLSSLVLYLAVEQNPVIEAELRSKVTSPEGFKILCPYIFSNKTNLGSTSQNLALRYNRGHGLKLRKILWAPYNNTENINTAFDHDNTAGTAKVASFYSTVNNVRTTQFNVDLTQSQDWMLQKSRIKGSSILRSNEYQYNWVWCEDFGDYYCPSEKPLPTPEANLVEGLSLDNEIKYDVFATTTNNNFNHYIFAVTLRLLSVSSGGIVLM